ncbi:MAG: tetratricopeptide repeat protein, partial [Bacteroidota bacterium]
TQEERWDMAPGFEKENLRFSRWLNTECLTCHNHYPGFVEGSLNKFTDMPSGIECERCHGPGEIHLAQKMAGEIVDTSQFIDYSIVNPRDLPRERQMDLCQRCHLQGVAVLEKDKSFFDFKPGMKLSEVMNVFLPRYTNNHDKFIMASQADRLRMSKCYQLSEDLSCLSCHHPHHSVASTSKDQFNNSCKSCHPAKAKNDCSLSEAERLGEDNNCVACHMPRSGSIDIPHVNITDHYISKTTVRRNDPDIVSEEKQEEIARFLGLEILTKAKATDLDMARGYIALYDKYVTKAMMLDSAKYYLERSNQSFEALFEAKVHYYFASQSYEALIQLAQQQPIDSISDAWTFYRIGEAYFKNADYPNALQYYEKATEYKPFSLDFQEKLGNTYVVLQQLDKATRTFEFILKENDKRQIALCNLGYVYVLQQQWDKGEALYDQALQLDPDYVQAMLNKAAVRLYKKDWSAARGLLERILALQPNHPQARQVLAQLETMG